MQQQQHSMNPAHIPLSLRHRFNMSEGACGIDSNTLHAASSQIGQHCSAQNKAFMECKSRDGHPAACLKQGNDVTTCALALFKKLEVCQQRLGDYSACLDKNNKQHAKCRATQAAFDECAAAALK